MGGERVGGESVGGERVSGEWVEERVGGRESEGWRREWVE